MNSATVRVPAKINLALGVGARRDDGFHPLATVYQAIDLCDEVHVSARDDDQITVTVAREIDQPEGPQIPLDGTNLAVRAVALLRERMGRPDLGLDLAIRKVIPVAGGMAGGSADAAGALVGANAVWSAGWTRDELTELAAEIGSDVPFLLHGGTAMGAGRGEVISPVLARGTFHWVCVTMPYGLSTAEVFAEFDRLRPDAPEPKVPAELLQALAAGDPVALGQALSNDLTEAAVSIRHGLRSLQHYGHTLGALGAVISGSGPTMLLLAESHEHALDLMAGMAALDTIADVLHAIGPVQGAHLV